jgi:hypothetical protein
MDINETEVRQGRDMVDEKFIRGFMSAVIIRVDGTEEVLCHNKENLLTDEGRDKFHEAIYKNLTATQAPFNFIGLSTSDQGSNPPLVGDTRADWESIETSGNGLDRIQAGTRNHGVGSNLTDLIQTFTAGAIVTDVQQAATLDRISTGDGFVGHMNVFAPASLEIGDQLIITWSFLLG